MDSAIIFRISASIPRARNTGWGFRITGRLFLSFEKIDGFMRVSVRKSLTVGLYICVSSCTRKKQTQVEGRVECVARDILSES